ncbi:MAG TPA: hypothetical protein VGD66_03565 [Allosphingosinicella sp.]|jgi:hypothetical protein
MKLSYTAVWDDTAALLRANGSLVAALAGVFFFLPALLVAYFLPQPQAATVQQMVPLFEQYFSANWYWILLNGLLGMAGTLAVMLLVFAPRGTTVAGAIAAAAALLPFYFAAALLSNLIIAVGLMLLIVPGIYLFGRLTPLAAVVAAENRRNPVDAITRCLAVTRGNGWAIVGMVILVAIAGAITVGVINTLLGLVLLLVLGKGLAPLLTMIVGAALGAALQALLVILFAALYRALVPGTASAAAAN